jgi:tetratricopeptide (TPR) repeat protein
MMQLPGDNELRVADTQQLRGWILLRLGRPQARDAFLSVVSSYEARSLPDHPTASSSREGLGRLAFAKGDLVSAQDFCQRSLQNYLKSYGYDSEDVADSLDCLGMVSTARGDYQTAAGQFQRALKAYENTFGPKHPKIAETLDHYAVVLKATGDVAQSASLTERAAAIRASFKAP